MAGRQCFGRKAGAFATEHQRYWPVDRDLVDCFGVGVRRQCNQREPGVGDLLQTSGKSGQRGVRKAVHGAHGHAGRSPEQRVGAGGVEQHRFPAKRYGRAHDDTHVGGVHDPFEHDDALAASHDLCRCRNRAAYKRPDRTSMNTEARDAFEHSAACGVHRHAVGHDKRFGAGCVDQRGAHFVARPKRPRYQQIAFGHEQAVLTL